MSAKEGRWLRDGVYRVRARQRETYERLREKFDPASSPVVGGPRETDDE